MKHLKLTVGSLFRLAAVAAIAMGGTTWIPHSSTTLDGNTSYYNLQLNGHRRYYGMSGNDMGARFEVKVAKVPGYGHLKSYYPNGNLREDSMVYIETQTDGLKVAHAKVQAGKYYLPDGTLCSSIENGSGVRTISRLSGKPFQEITLEHGRVIRQRTWYLTGSLFQESTTDGSITRVVNYFPEGMPRQVWNFEEGGRVIESQNFDREGNEVAQPVPVAIGGLL